MKYVLIVDDSRVVRKVSRGIFETLGFDIDEAEDGQDAMNKCKERTPDLIMLDWNMPVMDGMEFLLAFRQFREFADIPVIFCTTENDMSKIQEAIMNGANEYIMKPFDADIIKDKLSQLSFEF